MPHSRVVGSLWGVGAFFDAEIDLRSGDFADMLELLELMRLVGWHGMSVVLPSFGKKSPARPLFYLAGHQCIKTNGSATHWYSPSFKD